MIDFDFDKDCCGCSACANSCNHGAIEMRPNDEGFLMPQIDKGRCVDCGLCDKVCPHLNTPTDRSHFSLFSFKDKKAYLYFSKDGGRKRSASGGFVYDLYRKVLADGGLVCGCLWNDNLEAVHVLSGELDDLQKMQSSKYVQSNMQDCYRKVRNALREGKQVVFCGTPCQTAGLRSFLGKTDQSRLISVCLICHGVPSPGAWKAWKTVMEKKQKARMVDVNMRDKSYKGYGTSYVRYAFDTPQANGESVDAPHTSTKLRNVGWPTYLSDPYIFLFTDNLYLRHSCNHCQYKADRNGADIIVGDFYQSLPEAGDDGCSCLFAMTEKGDAAIKGLNGMLQEADYQAIGGGNNMLWRSVAEHPKRTQFFNRYKNETEPTASLFTDFLPLRFKIKKTLNRLGVFGFIRKQILRKK